MPVLPLPRRHRNIRDSVAAEGSSPLCDVYPAIAEPGPRNTLTVNVHARIYRPAPSGAANERLVRALAKRLGIPVEPECTPVFTRRILPFLAESLPGVRLTLIYGEQRQLLGATARNGHLRATLELPALSRTPLLLVADGTPLMISASVPLVMLPAKGISVISDIDDTIKISHVHDKRELLDRTFLRPFRSVAGMPDLYRRWEERGAVFHYTSATPWQLFAPLAEFMRRAGFPPGSFHLKQFRIKDRTALNMLAPSHRIKRETIAELFTRAPGRKFILVGDSGEGDPLLYAEMQRRFPSQVLQILIRDTGYAASLRRVEPTLTAQERRRWQIFATARTISDDFFS